MSVTKMYSVLDKWTDLEKENIVDFTSVDGTVTQARLNGVPVGGGGGGDFSTAKVTFTELSDQAVYMPYALTYGDNSFAAAVIADAGEYDAIKYKGLCIAEKIAAGYKIEVVSGSAEVEENMAFITGPCSLRVVPD